MQEGVTRFNVIVELSPKCPSAERFLFVFEKIVVRVLTKMAVLSIKVSKNNTVKLFISFDQQCKKGVSGSCQ